MNLGELVTYVTQKVEQIQPNDVAFCRMAISKRYELIFNSYLWKDSLIIVPVPFDPTNNPDNNEGVIMLPESVDRVVAIRTNCSSVRVNNMEHYFRVDYDAFHSSHSNWWGSVAEFSMLNPVWFIWRGYKGLAITVSNAEDGPVNFKVTWVDSLGNRYVQLLASGALLNSPVSVGTPADTSVLVVSGAGFAAVNDYYSLSGGFFITQTQNPTYSIYATSDPVYKYAMLLSSNDVNDVNTWVYKSPSLTGPWTIANLGTGPVPTSVYAPASRIEIESVFKPATKGTVTFGPQVANDVAGGTLAATDTRSPQHQRIRLFYLPSAAITVWVLGKKPFTQLDFDTEVPAIKNLDNCLIAFATAEMLERDKQYAKAQAKNQEGALLLKELASLEAVQAANHQQFIPENGMGNEFFGPSRSWGYGGY